MGDERAAGDALLQSYDAWEQVEDQVNEVLDQSLNPRGPEMLYDLVAELRLPAGAMALDVGCGRGGAAIAGADAALTELVHFQPGWAEEPPVPDESVDLVWCKDVLELVADLDAAYRHFQRVLKPDGRAGVPDVRF